MLRSVIRASSCRADAWTGRAGSVLPFWSSAAIRPRAPTGRRRAGPAPPVPPRGRGARHVLAGQGPPVLAGRRTARDRVVRPPPGGRDADRPGRCPCRRPVAVVRVSRALVGRVRAHDHGGDRPVRVDGAAARRSTPTGRSRRPAEGLRLALRIRPTRRAVHPARRRRTAHAGVTRPRPAAGAGVARRDRETPLLPRATRPS